MISKNAVLALVATFLATPVMADTSAELRFSDELDACVAALNAELNLEGVYRVRHIVTDSARKGLGYSLKIKTATFSKTAEKKYSVVCVATGNNEPSRLKVAEVSI